MSDHDLYDPHDPSHRPAERAKRGVSSFLQAAAQLKRWQQVLIFAAGNLLLIFSFHFADAFLPFAAVWLLEKFSYVLICVPLLVQALRNPNIMNLPNEWSQLWTTYQEVQKIEPEERAKRGQAGKRGE
ncbi:MAG: hypothetical protein H0T73_10380 [Ardenticatenales bacterium]|nr:hypothetical protein [Ardenticatenales bacterium]